MSTLFDDINRDSTEMLTIDEDCQLSQETLNKKVIEQIDGLMRKMEELKAHPDRIRCIVLNASVTADKEDHKNSVIAVIGSMAEILEDYPMMVKETAARFSEAAVGFLKAKREAQEADKSASTQTKH